MENPQYEQLQLFYTSEEVEALKAEHLKELERVLDDNLQSKHLTVLREVALQNAKTSEAICNVLKSEVQNGTMTKEDAQELYDEFVTNAGLVAKTISSKYTVTVYFRGNEVGTFEEVEADNAESAESLVLENMGIDTTLTIELDYNGDSRRDKVGIDSWDFSDDFTAEAVED